MIDSQAILDAYATVSAKINSRATLVAVSKVQSSEKISVLLEQGQRIFGENRVQEAMEKWGPLKEAYTDIELHLIGGLQTNKVKEAVQLFDVIESVDREKLARKLKEELTLQNKLNMPLLIQVNIGKEPQKSGVHPEETKGFFLFCREDLSLNIQGLMCLPPLVDDPTPYFKELKNLVTENNLSQCSMGMSRDFEEAIACGATHVRVGSMLFGARS
ncbi:MAG: YggS family pyridoxal phosphate-dependent enzyme [Alphaproteobacteria bacterium]